VGFDSIWRLVDIAGYRADPTPAATVGEIWRRAGDGASWAHEVELPDRHDIGLLMQLGDCAGRDPVCRILGTTRQDSLYAPGGRFAGATHADKNALDGAFQPFRRDRYWLAKERQLVLKVLKVKAEGAPEILVGPRKLAAASRLAAVLEENLAADETLWAAATKYVERPTFDAFLTVLKGLPPERVLMTKTF